MRVVLWLIWVGFLLTGLPGMLPLTATEVAGDDPRWQQLQARAGQLLEEEDYEAAAEAAFQCVVQSERVYKDHDIRRVQSLRLQARAAGAAGRTDVALRAQAKALRLMQEFHDGKSAEMGRALYEMAQLQLDSHRADAARNFLEGALEIQDRMAGGEHPDTLDTLHLLADACLRLDELDRADDVLGRLIPVFEKTPGSEGRLAAELDALGVLKQRRGDLDAAAALFRRALEIQQRLSGRDSPFAGWCHYRLGALRLLAGQPEEAIARLDEALRRLRPWAGARDFRVELAELARAIALHLLRRDGEIPPLVVEGREMVANEEIRPLLASMETRLLRFVQRDPAEAARLVEKTAAAAPPGAARLRAFSLLGLMRSLEEPGQGDEDFARASREIPAADGAARRELARRQAVAALAAGDRMRALQHLEGIEEPDAVPQGGELEERTMVLAGIVHLHLLDGRFPHARQALASLLCLPDGKERQRALSLLGRRWADWLAAVRRQMEETE